MQWCKLDWNTLLRIISLNPKRKPHAGYSSPCKSGESWKVLKEIRKPPNLSNPPVQNQSHCRVSFLLHYFLEKSLKTPRYPRRRVFWGKDAWVLQKMNLFAVPPGIYPWAAMGCYGEGAVRSCLLPPQIFGMCRSEVWHNLTQWDYFWSKGLFE